MQKQEVIYGVLDPEQEDINTVEIARIQVLTTYHMIKGAIIQ